jgi:hypothetical protein
MMPGNIASMQVGGREVNRYHELDDDDEFTFETDSGLHYRAIRVDSPQRRRKWLVMMAETDALERRVGSVTRSGWRGQYNYYYRKTKGGFFDNGYQNDLWNAVQSLTE